MVFDAHGQTYTLSLILRQTHPWTEEGASVPHILQSGLLLETPSKKTGTGNIDNCKASITCYLMMEDVLSCVVGQFLHYVNITECSYTNLHRIGQVTSMVF